jgi:hypothetical protein
LVEERYLSWKQDVSIQGEGWEAERSVGGGLESGAFESDGGSIRNTHDETKAIRKWVVVARMVIRIENTFAMLQWLDLRVSGNLCVAWKLLKIRYDGLILHVTVLSVLATL